MDVDDASRHPPALWKEMWTAGGCWGWLGGLVHMHPQAKGNCLPRVQGLSTRAARSPVKRWLPRRRFAPGTRGARRIHIGRFSPLSTAPITDYHYISPSLSQRYREKNGKAVYLRACRMLFTCLSDLSHLAV